MWIYDDYADKVPGGILVSIQFEGEAEHEIVVVSFLYIKDVIA